MSAYPPPVPKPPNAGAGQSAIANTVSAFANVRNGPGTQYRDIGDLMKNTLTTYYPGSRTTDGWVWIDYGIIGGWVSTSVVTFEPAPVPPPPTGSTPYSSAVALWHWRGDSVSENSIDEFARNIRTNAPYVTQVWVKSNDWTEESGARWLGYWDTKRSLAIDGVSSIDRWVQTLATYSLELHLWCVPRGGDVNAETDLIIQACKRPGVKSMILDVEPYAEFWQGGREGVRPFMTRVTAALPANFHIGMSVDPRSHHYNTIFPEEWKPFVSSIHPQVYWNTMRRTPQSVLEETYRVWGPYAKPIIPALQGDAPPSEMETARTTAINQYRAEGLSWYRAGVIGPLQYAVINKPMTPNTPPPPPPPPAPPEVMYVDEQVIRVGETGYNDFSYTGQRTFQSFTNTWGWTAYYAATQARTSTGAARWTPRLTQAGKHEVAVFVPGRHSNTTNARYKIHGITGATGEVVSPVNQSLYLNQWVVLGVFELNPNAINAGTVFLNDLTGETGKEIAFDAVRWRRVVTVQPGSGGAVTEGYADGFDMPMGTVEERRSAKVWGGDWYDASPFGKVYYASSPNGAYHTGADLNLPKDKDAHSGVYAVASGTVTFAGRLPIWGNVVIIRHDPLSTTGKQVYARYAHVEEMSVKVGDRVRRGQQIAKVGNAFGRYAYHLHFDISPTTILEQNPEHWPGMNKASLDTNYVDPREFIAQNRPK
jgi:murein DD-endopeptidase MepM/ murein hydrolase activator NlpD